MKTKSLLTVAMLLVGCLVLQAQSNPSKKETVPAAKSTVSGLAAADV